MQFVVRDVEVQHRRRKATMDVPDVCRLTLVEGSRPRRERVDPRGRDDGNVPRRFRGMSTGLPVGDPRDEQSGGESPDWKRAGIAGDLWGHH